MSAAVNSWQRKRIDSPMLGQVLRSELDARVCCKHSPATNDSDANHHHHHVVAQKNLCNWMKIAA
jgi:hypothetical protein